jgi:hypothetical protein
MSCQPNGPRFPHCWGSAITLSHTTRGRIPLDEELAHRNTQNSPATDMPPAGFDPTAPASERPQTRALDCVATGIGLSNIGVNKPRKIRWAGHAAQKTSAYVILVVKPKGKKPLGKVGISWRLILCLVLKKLEGRAWSGCIQLAIGIMKCLFS